MYDTIINKHNYVSQYIDIVNSSRSIKQVKNKILDLSKSINTRI